MARKTKLAKLLESEETYEYETTLRDAKEWFYILNRLLFNNKLPPVDVIDIRWRRGAHAWYDYDEKLPGTGTTKLLLSKRYKSKQFFIEVLGHEMIHHYQYIYEETVGHGPSFFKWRDTFNEKGLNLVRAY